MSRSAHATLGFQAEMGPASIESGAAKFSPTRRSTIQKNNRQPWLIFNLFRPHAAMDGVASPANEEKSASARRPHAMCKR